MKKTIIALSLIATAFNGNSQTKDSLSLCYDVMTEEYKPSCPYYIINSDNKESKAVRLDVILKYENGEVKYNGLCIKSIGIGNCVENDRLIIMFDDGTKYTTKSWSSFDCDGWSFFDVYGKDKDLINKKITAVMFVNGRSYDSYKFNVTGQDSNYFIRVFNAIENKMYKQTNCE
jgi:hypothetical protein